MKKISSILFAILILLNVLGYYGLFIGLQFQNDRKMTGILDAGDYNESESVLIKIPLAIPYMNDSEDFERVDGKFEHNGEIYRLVKQRFSADTVYVLCVKDRQGKRIDEALATYVSTFADSPTDHKTTTTKILIDSGKDYLTSELSIIHDAAGWGYKVSNKTILAVFLASYYPSIILPPELI